MHGLVTAWGLAQTQHNIQEHAIHSTVGWKKHPLKLYEELISLKMSHRE